MIKNINTVRCENCKHWGKKNDTWYDNARPCYYNGDLFYIDGGDGTDGFYTTPQFGCIAGETPKTENECHE